MTKEKAMQALNYTTNDLSEVNSKDIELAVWITQDLASSWSDSAELVINPKNAKRFKTTTKRLAKIFPARCYTNKGDDCVVVLPVATSLQRCS